MSEIYDISVKTVKCGSNAYLNSSKLTKLPKTGKTVFTKYVFFDTKTILFRHLTQLLHFSSKLSLLVKMFPNQVTIRSLLTTLDVFFVRCLKTWHFSKIRDFFMFSQKWQKWRSPTGTGWHSTVVYTGLLSESKRQKDSQKRATLSELSHFVRNWHQFVRNFSNVSRMCQKCLNSVNLSVFV